MSAADFAAALLNPGAPCPAGLVTWNGSDAAQRFGVYQNNVTVSLVEAVADTFPVVQQLVGEPFFRAMAGEFVRHSPPTSPVLAWYGDRFADFVASFPPAAGVPYLADVARLEYARVQAFHAADAEPLPLGMLAACLADPQALPQLKLHLHPSLQVLASPFAIVSLWAVHQGIGDIGRVDPQQAQCALVLRHGLSVEITGVSDDTATFIIALQAGETLGEAVLQATAEAAQPFDPAAALGLLINRQILVGLQNATEQQQGEQA